MQHYNPGIQRHTVKYDDGDVEIINLSKEHWELKGPPLSSDDVPSGPHSRGSSSRYASASEALQDGTLGVLLDCTPTLAMFHPTNTRHPYTWSNMSDRKLVDVNSKQPGDNHLTLLDALASGPMGLVEHNAALFFRKVAELQRQVEQAQLLDCLQLLWQGRARRDKKGKRK
jgi:hypothetical protein